MTGYDEAASNQPRHFALMDGYQSTHLVMYHFETADLRLGVVFPPEKDRLQERRFHSNNQVWEAILRERIQPPMRMTLESFFLFDWFPRVPGLYFTDDARTSRQFAQSQIESIQDGVVVYNPIGKTSMIDGGVGNVRLKPIHLHHPECYLMSASSSGDCHQGFPVAVPANFYEPILPEILERGCKVVRLSGCLRFLPGRLTQRYRYYRKVPEIYLEVDDLSQPRYSKSRSMEDVSVSVAISFISKKSRPTIYAAYVNFQPGQGSSFRDNVNWLEEVYVAKKYHGEIITDFDERQSHFPSAVFGVSKVMDLRLAPDDMMRVARYVEIDFEEVLSHQRHIQLTVKQVGEMYMGPKYSIQGGQQAAVGDNASATNFTQVWHDVGQEIDLKKLAEELGRLRNEARALASSPEEDAAVGNIAEAQVAASNGDGPKALQHLARAGAWALDIATRISVSVAGTAISRALGL